HKKDGLWHIVHTNTEHNHEPSTDPRHHPQHCRLSSEEREFVEQETKAGVTAANICIGLKEKWPNCLATRRTVYNTQLSLRQKELNGRSEIQALLDEM
ncbi:hypothetical protein BJ508DRAFT_201168, partial [Ascobolus immersus RN42]